MTLRRTFPPFALFLVLALLTGCSPPDEPADRSAPGPSGVVVHDRDRTGGGLNFWISGHRPGAFLMGMEGTIVHEWHCRIDEAFPEAQVEDGSGPSPSAPWRRARLLPSGDVVGAFEGLGVFRIDSASRVLWVSRITVHDDFDVGAEGDLWVLTREEHLVPRISPKNPIQEDLVVVLDAETGAEKRRISLLECYDRGGEAHPWAQAYALFWEREAERRLADTGPLDVFHANSLEVLRGPITERGPEFREGNLLLSLRNLDAIAVVDPGEEKVVWSMSGAFTLPHAPTATPNGGILVFDNQWKPHEASRIVLFDPRDLSILWTHEGSEEHPLFSRSFGHAQPLRPDNCLITESSRGRVLEVASDGTVVWEFRNPHRTGPRGELPAPIFEMVRLPAEFPMGWATGPAEGG